MKKIVRSREGEHGVALVTTVIVVAVMAVVAVAFMQSTTVDRLSSRSVANYYRAKLAAEAGLADFTSLLASVAATNDFAVISVTNAATPQEAFTVLAAFRTNGALQIYPLASRPAASNPLTVSAPFTSSNLFTSAAGFAPAAQRTNLNALFGRLGGIEYPATNADTLVLNASFVVCATNSGGSNVAEYAYVVADDCARLNLAVFGANYTGGARANPEPRNFPAEVAVAGVGPRTATVAEFDSFKNLPSANRNRVIFASVFGSTNARRANNRFYGFHSGQVFDLIPSGYLDDARSVFRPYADSGKFKYDINRMATNSGNAMSNAFKIADIIASNLPSFRLRDPSFVTNSLKPSDPDLRYARRIAAAIVDYVDTDSKPTTITDGEPAGKEAVAYPFQVAERYDWVGTSPGASETSWTVTVRQTVFVELWNPHTVPVSGDFKFELETFRQIEPPGGAFVPIPKLSANTTVSLQPNEIKVFKLGSKDFTFNVTGPNPSINPKTTPLLLQQTSSTDANKPKHSMFKAFWDGSLFDLSGSYNLNLFDERGTGLLKNERLMTDANRTDRPTWSANSTRTVPPAGASGAYRSVGDPRQNYANNYVWEDTAYTNENTRWNGANRWPALSPTTHKFETVWAARDGFRAALNIGGQAGAAADPTSVTTTYTPAQSNNAPAFVRNGTLETIAELGHIYDPVHLDDVGAVTPNGGEPNSAYSSGGGRTLRIGQPEPVNHATLNVAGQRAMNLLDVFTARPVGEATNAPRQAGLNINTAPVNVLAAFFYNLQPVSDGGLGGAPKISLAGATNIATNIVANRPYFAASDMHRFLNELASVRTNYAPAIAGVGAFQGPIPNMHDRAREELFRRAYGSLETKSGAFRYYGIGRSLSPAGAVESSVLLEAWVELKMATNAITGQVLLQPVVTQRKFF